MGHYTITDNAAADLAALWDSFTERGGAEVNADRLISRLFETFQNLADFPDMGTRRDATTCLLAVWLSLTETTWSSTVKVLTGWTSCMCFTAGWI